MQKHGRYARSAGPNRRNIELVLSALPGDVTVAGLAFGKQAEAVRKLRAQGLGAGTVKRAMGIARAAVNYAWKNGEIDRPAPFVSLPDGAPRERVLSVDELAKLWDADMPAHMRVFLVLLLGTAARPEAALELARSQCDLARGVVDLNPPGRERTKKRRPRLPIPEFLRPWLQVQDGPLVTWRGRPAQKIAKAWQTVRKSAGLDAGVTAYTIRDTVATEMLARGVPGPEISGWLGHDMPNFRTTARYVHFAPNHLSHAREAVEALVAEIAAKASTPFDPLALSV